MSVLTLQGEPEIEVLVRQSLRARRMTLRISQLDGRVTLTVPSGMSADKAKGFAVEREAWIRKHLSQQVAPVSVALGAEIPVLGQMRVIAPGSGRSVQMTDDALLVPGAAKSVGRKLQGWLKQTARSELAFASDRYSEALGRRYAKISLRDTRSRWGSCTSAGGLMYSWRLIMAPAEVLAYVAAHEVAHLAEMNHSPAFWDTVERIHGPYAEPRRWLRRKGHHLHRYRFTD